MKKDIRAPEMLNLEIQDFIGIYRSAVGRFGMSENEFWIWYALIALDGGYSQQDICGILSLSKQTVNTIVGHMVRKGFAFLTVIPGTRNRKRICLTEAGKRYGEGVVRPLFNAERRALEKLPEEERTVCAAVFRKYISLLKEEMRAFQRGAEVAG